jgi:hypothetical protein
MFHTRKIFFQKLSKIRGTRSKNVRQPCPRPKKFKECRFENGAKLLDRPRWPRVSDQPWLWYGLCLMMLRRTQSVLPIWRYLCCNTIIVGADFESDLFPFRLTYLFWTALAKFSIEFFRVLKCYGGKNPIPSSRCP